MNKFFLLFLIASTANAAFLPPINTMTCGGFTFSTTSLVALSCQTNVGASVGHCSFRKFFTSSGYTPSGSNKFRPLCLKVGFKNAGAAGSWSNFGYTDNDVGYESNTASTNMVNMFGGTGGNNVPVMLVNTNVVPTNGQSLEVAFPGDSTGAVVPNGKFITVNGDASATSEITYELFGVEQP